MPSGLSLFVYLLVGAVGVAYFVYGKRQQNGAFLAAGVLLCIYPYFFESALGLIAVGLVLLSAPILLSK